MNIRIFFGIVFFIVVTGRLAFSQEEVELEGLPGLVPLEETETSIEELPPEPKEIPLIKVKVKELDLPEGKDVVLDVYTVKKGDWLAKIAGRNYGNHALWKVIHGYNKHIKNAHWIFPGDKLILPVIVDKLPEIPARRKEEHKGKIAEELREYGNFIAPSEFEFNGTIAGFKKEKVMHSQGDYLFIDLGREQGITENQRLYVYRMSRYVAHPYTGEILGSVVERIGEIRVAGDIEENSATARIIYSDRSIEEGDMLLLKK